MSFMPRLTRKVRRPRYEPRTPVVSEVVIGPLDKDQQAIVELHQVHQMHEEPNQPGRHSGQMYTPEIGDGRCPADCRKASFVAVMKWLGGFAAEPSFNEPCGI